MKSPKLSLIRILLLTSSMNAMAQSLVDELKVFEPYLGTWQADFPAAENKPAMQDVSHWERALNGTAVRTLHSINDGMYGGESLIFWDKTKQQVVFYYFTTAGFYTTGYMSILADGSFVAYEDVEGNQDGISKVKSTSRFVEGKMHVATQYLKNGQWTSPEARVYERSNKQVMFR